MHELTVTRSEFMAALRRLRSALRSRKPTMAQISFRDGTATLSVPGAETHCACKGQWPGRALFSSAALKALLRVPPSGETLLIRCDKKRVSLSTLRLECDWYDIGPSLADVPTPETLEQLAELVKRHGSVAVRRFGASHNTETLAKHLRARVSIAERALGEYGITEKMLTRLVIEHVLKGGPRLGSQ